MTIRVRPANANRYTTAVLRDRSTGLPPSFSLGDVASAAEGSSQFENVIDAKEVAFLRQRRAFRAIAQGDLIRYRGQFVVAKDGQIVDHDHDLVVLSGRFFAQHPNDSVYVTFVDGPALQINTPFFQ